MQAAKTINEVADALINILDEKQKNLTKIIPIVTNDFEEKLNVLSKIFNETEDSLHSSAKDLEFSIIIDFFDGYWELKEEINNIEKSIEEKSLRVLELKALIEKGEKDINDINLPIQELNEDLKNFLGHSELKFIPKKDEFGESYFQIQRGEEEVATNLSEGEKSAISLIYFLKKLKEKNNILSSSIIFIDDPFSSLDSQFLFSAYSFIVSSLEKTDGSLSCKQIFITSHNYDFFNLFKRKYFHPERDNNRCNLYMLKVALCSGKRTSNIYNIDPLLEQFDSDYQYLFSRLIELDKAADQEVDNLKFIYPYPNISRRVLETFLSFIFPSKTDYRSQLDAMKNYGIAQTTIETIYKFTNLESHGTLREAQGFTVMNEPSTKDRIKEILSVMRTLNKGHYEEMESKITKLSAK